MSESTNDEGALRAVAGGYLLLSSAAGAAFWAWVALSDPARAALVNDGVSEAAMWSLVAPDLLLFCACGVAAGIGLIRRARWAAAPLWVHVGAAGFGGLYTMGLALTVYGAPGVAAGLAVAAALPLAIALRFGRPA